MSTRHRGDFAPGYDPRRHILTAEERRRGGLTRGAQIRYLIARAAAGRLWTDDLDLAAVGEMLRDHCRAWRRRR